MPLYDFRCSAGHGTEASFAITDRPDHVACPVCGQTSRRRIPSPRLSIAGSSAFGLLESTQRSAHEPEVVASTNPGTRPPTPTTSNPLHRKLPRP